MKRALLLVVGIVVGVGATIALLSFAPQVNAQVPIGRYEMRAAGTEYSNFVWVLDTTNGDVASWRVASTKDGDDIVWVYEEMESIKEYLERRRR